MGNSMSWIKKQWPILMLAVSLALVGAMLHISNGDNEPQSPSSSFRLSDEELKGLEADAKKDDLDAIRKLIDFFERYNSDQKQADVWRQRARELGDPFELALHATYLLSKSMRVEGNNEEKLKLLNEALANAKRAFEADKSDSNKKLIQKIQSDLQLVTSERSGSSR
jgi:hypothetical protein